MGICSCRVAIAGGKCTASQAPARSAGLAARRNRCGAGRIESGQTAVGAYSAGVAAGLGAAGLAAPEGQNQCPGPGLGLFAHPAPEPAWALPFAIALAPAAFRANRFADTDPAACASQSRLKSQGPDAPIAKGLDPTLLLSLRDGQGRVVQGGWLRYQGKAVPLKGAYAELALKAQEIHAELELTAGDAQGHLQKIQLPLEVLRKGISLQPQVSAQGQLLSEWLVYSPEANLLTYAWGQGNQVLGQGQLALKKGAVHLVASGQQPRSALAFAFARFKSRTPMAELCWRGRDFCTGLEPRFTRCPQLGDCAPACFGWGLKSGNSPL